MNSHRILTVFIVALFFCGSYAQPPRKGPHSGNRSPVIAPFGPPQMNQDGPKPPPPMIMDVSELQSTLAEIGIEQKTVDKISEITRNFITEFNRNILAVQRKELDIKEELLKETPDLKKIRKSIMEKTKIFSEIEFAQIKRDLDIKSLLTPEEYEKLKSLTMKKFKEMMPDKMNGRRPHDGNKKQPSPAD